MLVLLLFSAIFSPSYALNPCLSYTFNGVESNVCVCNATYCDDIPPIPQLNDIQAAVYMTSKSGKRFELATTSFSSDSGQNAIKITIDPSQIYQKILGFGGAFTGSATHEIFRLDPKAQENLLNSYFGPNGIGYTLGRVPIATSDFSISSSSYDDDVNDTNLSNFSLLYEDTQYKIPAIQKALNLTKKKIKLLSSPWSAPGWMKANGLTYNGSSLLGYANDTKDVIHKSYANYFVKFFEEYMKNHISFWSVTVQNEPLNFAFYQSMIMQADEQRDFLKNHLGPALKNSSLTKDLKIMIWDFNKGKSRDFIDTVLADPQASQYVDGIAMHWYDDFGWFGDRMSSEVLDNIHQNHPEKFILNTEGCTYFFPEKNQTRQIGTWWHGDFYARDIIDLFHALFSWNDKFRTLIIISSAGSIGIWS